MKKIIFFYLLLFSINLFSQTETDSLELKLKTVIDKEKVDILNELAQAYLTESPQNICRLW